MFGIFVVLEALKRVRLLPIITNFLKITCKLVLATFWLNMVKLDTLGNFIYNLHRITHS